MLDVTGRTVATQTIAAEQAQQPVYVTTTTLPAGIYTVQVSSNSQVSVARVVVQ